MLEKRHDLFGRGGLDSRGGLETMGLLHGWPWLELPCCRCQMRVPSGCMWNLTGVLVAVGAEVAGFVDLPLMGRDAHLMDGVVDQVAYLRRFQDRVQDCGLAVPAGTDNVARRSV